MATNKYFNSLINNKITRAIGVLGLGLAVLATAGCGGGSGDSSTTSGEVGISLTDAAGDFVAYGVDVTSLQLVKQNGTEVSALPTTTRVDFTQYTDLSEFLTVATVPSGRYTQVIMNLDYSNADVEVQDASGNVQKATPEDSSGNPLTTLSVTLNLDSADPLVIAPGIPASLALDFDLSASNQVDLTASPPVVQVEPFLVADLSLDSSREHRAHGLLKDVDTTASDFEMYLWPFILQKGELRTRDWGLVTVTGTATTHYEINGTAYDGADGLTKLATISPETPIIVKGTIAGKKSLNATEVLAGTSVPWSNKDVVQGTVIKRSGDTLTVRGHYINRSDGIAIFNSDIDVTVDAGTKVTAPLSSLSSTDKDSISVGQAITAFGTLNLSGTPYLLDSTGTDNLVRMDVTQLKGAVNMQSSSLLDTDLAYIQGRRVNIFDFTGTGSDPNHYLVNTGSLLTGTTINPGDIVKIRGFVEPFGQAGTLGDDFSAISVIDLNQNLLGSNLALRWLGGTTTAFTAINNDAITIDLSGVNVGNLWLSDVSLGLGSATAITLTPQNATSGHYAIKQRGQAGITLYQKFADFSAALTTAMGNGARVVLIVAHGDYASTGTTLSSSGALVLLSR